MQTSDLIKLDRAGISGLICLVISSIHLFVFPEHDLLVAFMVIFAILAVFFIQKDRQEKEIMRMNQIILFTVIGGILLFDYYAYRFDLFS